MHSFFALKQNVRLRSFGSDIALKKATRIILQFNDLTIYERVLD